MVKFNCSRQGPASSPLTELSLLANCFLEDFVVSLQQSVVFGLELLQLCCAALEALLALCQPGPQLLYPRGQLLPARHTIYYYIHISLLQC